jgi:murein DD-endopeptidase MepM/ murein hydrolase activator NlpD
VILVRLWQKIALGVAGVAALFSVGKKGGNVSNDDDDDDDTDHGPGGGGGSNDAAPQSVKGIPFAHGDVPIWPTLSTHARSREVPYIDVNGGKHGNLARRFGAKRTDHWHHGIDLYTNVHDPVVAMESGTITGLHKTFHLGTGAVVLVTDSGMTIVYGEIGPNTWKEFGIAKGMHVAKGQRLARVEPNTGGKGTFMLHLETYAGAFSTNDPPVSAILNPTAYLLEARANTGAVS